MYKTLSCVLGSPRKFFKGIFGKGACERGAQSAGPWPCLLLLPGQLPLTISSTEFQIRIVFKKKKRILSQGGREWKDWTRRLLGPEKVLPGISECEGLLTSGPHLLQYASPCLERRVRLVILATHCCSLPRNAHLAHSYTRSSDTISEGHLTCEPQNVHSTPFPISASSLKTS